MHACAIDLIALSHAVIAEIRHVLARPKITGRNDLRDVESLIDMVLVRSVMFDPKIIVTDCRDPTDNMYLELALESRAHTIISSDAHLLSLSPWRSVAIITPAAYLAAAAP
jgi:putative PIN family toxin of toxin-antitoxin system